MSRKIKEIMTPGPVTVPRLASVRDAARWMRDTAIGDVLVSDDVSGDGRLLGLVTDRDLVVRVLAAGLDPDSTNVGDVCSSQLVSVAPDDDVGHAVDLMRRHALRRLPVLDDGRAVGVVSIGDLAMERDPDSALADISAADPNS
ncbi:CBS domain-containing protein [Kitasatospora cathayae]|uniref:CBS domain-containing protein n=1 Tax=Kitasatospora cathayae TaxID=3004092 RepID=A0ABY7PX87_9ACTN|nr:CBS domain-containing protein [Kitasatospora sp. HUAS 3-15]WBP84986.1 CBS domain-containing protein [Kitasatospora sp. HUAS 3-15]